MVKRYVLSVLFLAIAIALVMIDPVEPLTGEAPESSVPSETSAYRAESFLVAQAAVSTANVEKGRRIFMRDCARCHGDRGDGVSPIAGTLQPSPFDLTSFELADSFVVRVVRDGVPGTDMPGWSLGTDEDVRAVSAYTTRLARRDELPLQARYAASDALQEAGRRVYSMHCTSCHDERGSGDGAEAAKRLPRPASFADMRPSYAAARRVIESGVHGTAMPSWPLLTAPEIQAVTFYIRTFYAGTGSGAGARP